LASYKSQDTKNKQCRSTGKPYGWLNLATILKIEKGEWLCQSRQYSPSIEFFFGGKLFLTPQLKRVVAGLFWALKDRFTLFLLNFKFFLNNGTFQPERKSK